MMIVGGLRKKWWWRIRHIRIVRLVCPQSKQLNVMLYMRWFGFINWLNWWVRSQHHVQIHLVAGQQYWFIYNTNNEKKSWQQNITEFAISRAVFRRLVKKISNVILNFKHNTKNDQNICDCVFWKWIYLITTLKCQIIKLNFYDLIHHYFWIMITHLNLRIIKRIMIDFKILFVITDLNERYKIRNYYN